MERVWGTRTGAVLAGIRALLDESDDDRALASDAERVAWMGEAIEAADRLRTLAAVLVAEADATGADLAVTGLGCVSWLADTRRMTRREVLALLHEGRDLVACPEVRDAGLAGQVSPSQARAITGVLGELPEELATDQRARAEAMMLDFAAEFDARGLVTLADHLLEVIAPDVAERLEAARLERQQRRARRNRRLSFTHDGHGSVLVRGCLPAVAAQTLIAQIDAIAHSEHRRALDALDPLAEEVTPTMRRADALLSLADAAAAHRDAPSQGGDRPRITVTIDWHQLRELALGGRVIGPDEPVSPGQLRQLCCDADILPVILAGDSQVLDVGREHRLVTGPIRTALTARDRGCVFPGCDKPAAACHAHHVVPWQAGGPTSLENLVLVCPHHHGIVEPTTGPQDRRWQIRLADDGVPEVLPPVHVDPTQRPRRHQRHRRPQAA